MDYTLKNKVTTEDFIRYCAIDITLNSSDNHFKIETMEANEDMRIVTSFRNNSENNIEVLKYVY